MKMSSCSRQLNLPIAVLVCVFAGVVKGGAVTESNPYSAIAGRNVFSLRPLPVNIATNSVPPTPASGIELQGFSTILGRPQVLLKVKVPPKPPEPAKDKALVMDVGQRDGDVEVVSMDAYAGTVNLKNQGNLVSLNLKDNAAKPQAGPSLPTPMLPSSGIRPTIPPPGGPAASPGGGIPLPTRSLRSGGDSASSGTSATGAQAGTAQVEAINRNPEVNVANYAVSQAKNEEARQSGALIPKLPKHPFLRDQE
jgi:hypothetical protein